MSDFEKIAEVDRNVPLSTEIFSEDLFPSINSPELLNNSDTSSCCYQYQHLLPNYPTQICDANKSFSYDFASCTKFHALGNIFDEQSNTADDSDESRPTDYSTDIVSSSTELYQHQSLGLPLSEEKLRSGHTNEEPLYVIFFPGAYHNEQLHNVADSPSANVNRIGINETTNPLAEHTYCMSSRPPMEMQGLAAQEVNDMIEFDWKFSGGHYTTLDDALAVKPFDPRRKTNSRVTFKTVSTILPDEEMYIYVQYRKDAITSPRPIHELEPSQDYFLPVLEIDEVKLKRKCSCFQQHPSAAFCVSSTKAKVTWDTMSGVPVAKLTVMRETDVDVAIGFWSSQSFKRHNHGKVFSQLVFSVKKSNTVYEQCFFYKTCISVSRDIQIFSALIEGTFPNRLKPYHRETVAPTKRGRKPCKSVPLLEPAPLKINLKKEWWPQLQKILESTNSLYKTYEQNT